MSTQQALALPSPAASNTVVINARCSLRIEAGQRVIVVAGLPVHHYRAEDAVAEAYAMVFLVASGIVLRPPRVCGADQYLSGFLCGQTAPPEKSKVLRQILRTQTCPL